MTEWVIVAALCCGVHGELLFASPSVRFDRTGCMAAAAAIQARYVVAGRAALVRCREVE